MRTIGGDEPAWIVATISKPAFGRETCFVGWTTTDMQGSDPGRIGEGHAAEEPRHTSVPVQDFACSSVHQHFQSVRCFALAIVTPNMIGHYWRSISSHVRL